MEIKTFVNNIFYNDIGFIVSGNKSDLYRDEKVSEQKGKDYAEAINAEFYLTSSLANVNIDEMFYQAGKMYLIQQGNFRKRKQSVRITNYRESAAVTPISAEENKKSKCCS